MNYHVVTYTGPFGFIKPWTAVRDGETFSQQFLTPSIVEGMEKKLFPELLDRAGIHKIERHRLAYRGLSRQMEVIHAADYKLKNIKGEKRYKTASRNRSILFRSVLIEPVLSLAFKSAEDALIASKQHLCLCRNEDLIYPIRQRIITMQAFDELEGFELRFGKDRDGAFLVGYNRYDSAAPMYGALQIAGNASQYETV